MPDMYVLRFMGCVVFAAQQKRESSRIVVFPITMRFDMGFCFSQDFHETCDVLPCESGSQTDFSCLASQAEPVAEPPACQS